MDFTGLSVLVLLFWEFFTRNSAGFALSSALNCCNSYSRKLEGESWRMLTGNRFWPLTNGRHGNKILKNEQHFFTFQGNSEIAEKKVRKASGIWAGLCVLLR